MKTDSYATENSLPAGHLSAGVEAGISTTDKIPVCQNCGETVSGQFCAACGQKHPQTRLTIKVLLHQMYESVFDFDRGFFFTVKELVIHPQLVIRNYLAGRRVIYTNPFKYLLLWLGLSTFIGLSLMDMDAFTRQMTQEVQWQQPTKKSAESEKKRKQVEKQTSQLQQTMLQNPQFMYAVLVPMLSMCSLWLFRKKGYTYAEHLLLDTYLMAQTIIITIPVYLLFFLFPKHLVLVSLISSLVAALYYAFAGMVIFNGTLLTAFKSLFSYIFAYVLLMIIVGVLGTLYTVFVMLR